VGEAARPLFQECLAEVHRLLPAGKDYGGWWRMARIAMEDLYALGYGHLAEDDERREQFLQAELRLTASFLLVKHLDDCRPFADEIIFYQRVRNQVLKALPGKKPIKEIERAVRDLVDDSAETEGVVDIFRVAGLKKADISILDDQFLQTFKDCPLTNLRLKLLEKLPRDEIRRRKTRNLARAKSFQELLEATLQRYHNRLIDAAAVVKALLAIHKDMESDGRLRRGGDPPRQPLRDVIPARPDPRGGPGDQEELEGRLDGAAPRRREGRRQGGGQARPAPPGVREAHFDLFLERIMEQAEAIYGLWPLAA
jgi:type I restriction enzyme R subunit